MKKTLVGVFSMVVGAVASPAFAVVTPQEITWVGGAAGDLTTAANWSPATVPSTKSSTKAYIAVFTNSTTVTLSTSSDYWYSGGIVVKNGADVVCTGTGTYRFYPTTADIGGDGDGGTNLVLDIETGSSLKFDGVVMRGLETVTLVKTGHGTFTTTRGIGINYRYRNVDVRNGTLDSTTTTRAYNLVPNLTVRAGAAFKTSVAGGLAESESPSVTIEEGGAYDAGGKNLALAHLNGSGSVSNVTTLTITGVGDVAQADFFSGRIYGDLSIAPTASTPEGSSFVIGSAETLAEASLSINTSACPSFQFRFAAGIGKFYCKSFPSETTFYDTDGNPVVLTNLRDWYVDASCAVSGDGKTPATAFKTLVESMENPDLKSGETVFVLPGRYESGWMKTSPSSPEINRVIVKAGVTLASTSGAEETLIIGEPSGSPIKAGCGDGAVRCVVLNAGSVLRGFTVTNGFTCCVYADAGPYYGGGVTGSGSSCVVEDCVVAGCSAVRGGGVNEVLCRRCKFLKNDTTYIGSAARSSDLYNCVFSEHTTGSYVTLYSTAVNCTFLGDNTDVYATWTNKDDTSIYFKNCLFLCKAGRDQKNFQNCAFAAVAGQVSDGNIGAGSFKSGLSDFKVDELGCPRASSPLVNAGSNALYSFESGGMFDLLNARRVNGGENIDIGAYEWCPTSGFMIMFR